MTPRLFEWFGRIRAFIVRRGIQAVCGAPDQVSTNVTADMSLITAGSRFMALRAAGAVGVKAFVAKSGLGYDFVCHIGDLAEYPFYMRRAFARELAIAVGWLRDEEAPVIYDLGANVGFISTHLAQMLAARSPRIYAVEPAPATFAKLEETVQRLKLGAQIFPIAAAATAGEKSVRIAWPKKNSLYGQVVKGAGEPDASVSLADAVGISLDEFSAETGAHPSLIKMDIEGSEVAALRGAHNMLAREDRPAILFEFNPQTLAECGASVEEFAVLLSGYRLYYIDDLRGQLLPFGSPVADLTAIWWICNLFAAPRNGAGAERWTAALANALKKLA